MKWKGQHPGTNDAPEGLAPEGLRWEDPQGRRMLKSCWLFDVTVLWLGIGDRKLFWGRPCRDEERCVEHRINVALVAHKMHVAVSFNETLARLVDGLVTILVIFTHGTSLDRNQNDTGMMVPASRASRFDDNLYDRNVCRTHYALHLDVVVFGIDLPERCSPLLGSGSLGSRSHP